jgi:hypothetical protein
VIGRYEPNRAELELLSETCRLLDLCDVLRETADSPMVDTTTGPRVHPALVELRQVRMEARRCLAALGIPEPAEREELPPGVARLRSQKARKAARARWDRRGA